MIADGKPSTRAKRLTERLHTFRRDAAGATAVEFAFIGLAFITLILGILQFALVFTAQMYIHDALSDAATGRTAATYAGNRSQVVTQICERGIALDNCAANLQLETQPLANYSATTQPVAGTTFVAGTSGTIMLMRARAPVTTIVPGLPTLHVSGAALYTRP